MMQIYTSLQTRTHSQNLEPAAEAPNLKNPPMKLLDQENYLKQCKNSQKMCIEGRFKFSGKLRQQYNGGKAVTQ